MKKHTSKSASAIPNSSSPSGTSAETAIMDGQFPESEAGRIVGAITEHMKAMSPDEFLASLVAMGIMTPEGELTEHYRAPKKRKKPQPKPS